jgi:hypothetical protein
MSKVEKITYVPTCNLRMIRKFSNTFYGMDKMGTLFEFTRLDLLTVKIEAVVVPQPL